MAILNYYAAGLLGSVVFENPMSAIVTGYFAGLALVLKIANAQCFNEPVLEPGLLFIGMAVPGLGLLSLNRGVAVPRFSNRLPRKQLFLGSALRLLMVLP